MAKKKVTRPFSRAPLSVLIPVYNEEDTVGQILDRVLELKEVHEIVVVDDCSTDNTPAALKKYARNRKIKLFRQEQNQGKTAAIARAIQEASGELIIIQDADLEYDPAEIPAVIEPILNGRADVVYGSRFLVRKAARVLYFSHYIANKGLTFLCNFFTNLNMTDMETCYKAFRAPVIKPLELTSKGFGMEVEITALISKLPLRIYEVPISYYGRTYDEGKKIGIKDGLLALHYIFYYNLFVPRFKRSREYFASVRSALNLK